MIKTNNIKRALITGAVVMLACTACGKTETSVETETTTQQETTTKAEETAQETTTQVVTEEATKEVDKPETEFVDNGFPSYTDDNSLIPSGETVRSFYTGEWINDSIGYRRPFAVMINNIQAGLPQRGISKADIIVEGQCEGSITRLMAIFQDYDAVDSLGSIRSCRDYFPWQAAEYDAAYFHFGQSDFALQFLGDPLLMTFNGMTGDYSYGRRSDRVSPHNVFTTPLNLVTAMANRKVTTYLSKDYIAPFNFNEEDEEIDVRDGQPCNTLKVGYSYNNAYFEYNPEDGLYYRFEYGKPQIDEMTGEQLAVKNVIIKYVPGEQYWNGSPLYILTGNGLALVASNGTANWVMWQKESTGVNTNLGCNYYYGYDATGYTYFDGVTVTLNRGKTWVCIAEVEEKDNTQIIE